MRDVLTVMAVCAGVVRVRDVLCTGSGNYRSGLYVLHSPCDVTAPPQRMSPNCRQERDFSRQAKEGIPQTKTCPPSRTPPLNSTPSSRTPSQRPVSQPQKSHISPASPSTTSLTTTPSSPLSTNSMPLFRPHRSPGYPASMSLMPSHEQQNQQSTRESARSSRTKEERAHRPVCCSSSRVWSPAGSME